MVPQRQNDVQPSAGGSPICFDLPDGTVIPPVLPLFRFRLRHLFWFVTALSILLASLVSSDGISAVALLLAVLVVAFHLFSTALGSQLRKHANRNQVWHFTAPERIPSHAAAGEAASHSGTALPAPSPWYGRNGIRLPWLRGLVAIAALCGGSLGVFLLSAAIGHRTSPAGLAVGAVSLAVMTGWAAFLGGNFVAIVRGGLSDAVGERQSDDARPAVRSWKQSSRG